MSLDGEIQAFLGEAQGKTESVKRALRSVLQQTRDARALYCDEKGQVRPEAVRHFAALARIAYPVQRHQTDIELREAAGARAMLRHILASINMDDARIIHLKNRLAALERGST